MTTAGAWPPRATARRTTRWASPACGSAPNNWAAGSVLAPAPTARAPAPPSRFPTRKKQSDIHRLVGNEEEENACVSTLNVAGLDLAAAEAEVVEHLQHLIRLNTVNPPGNETLAATYIRDRLAEVGIDSQLLEAVPGRANLVARWAGDGR